MKHPLSFSGHSSYGESADFSQYDVVDSQDFTSNQYALGDFSNYGSECSYGEEDLMGFGYDEGLGKGFKARVAPKAVVKKIAPSIVKKAVAANIKKVVPASALIPKGISVKQLKAVAPQAVIKKIQEEAKKAVAKVQAFIPQKAPQAAEEFDVVEPSPVQEEQVISQGSPLTQSSFNQPTNAQVVQAISQIQKNVHPMVSVHKKIKGEPMSGFLDDLKKQISATATKAYQANKDKAIAAAQTQATNLVGKTLNKLSATDPKALAAISKVAATAGTAAAAAAQQSTADKVKAVIEQNKKVIMIAGAGLAGLYLYKMLKK